MVLVQSQKFKNAVVSKNDMTITEIDKNEERVYDLNDVLKKWDGVENVAITIQVMNSVGEDGQIE